MKKKTFLIFIYGTRPEIIKLSPLIKLCRKKKLPYKMIHSGQHYSYNMDRVFFKDLALPKPDYALGIKSKAPFRQGEHTGKMLIGIEKILLQEMPSAIVVQGDTNTALAGALTAEKISTTKGYTGLEIKVAHVEAGLRSFDRTMPEEINRFLIDHISDFLFVPTPLEKKLVLKEGVPARNVYITGNTIADALNSNLKLAQKQKGILKKLSIEKAKYLLLTLHRQENVDSGQRFLSILDGIRLVVEKLKMPLIFPAHPRTVKKMKQFNVKLRSGIKIIKPVNFLTFLYLESNAALVLTDSGGVQEETCILKVPCVTLRENTERPQTLKAGSNIIGGTKPTNILRASIRMIGKNRNWSNPFGNGKASDEMLKILLSNRD